MKSKFFKNKYIFILIFVFILVVILLLNIKNISKLFASAGRAGGDRYSETISEICNTITNNDYFMTVSFGIYQNYGPSGDADIILTPVDSNFKELTKSIKVDSGSRANFSYTVPKGKYKLTIKKTIDVDGEPGNDFETYNHNSIIDENTNYFTVKLLHANNSNLIVSGHLYMDTYYDYLKNDRGYGTIRIYKNSDSEMNLGRERYSYTILGKVVKDMLKKHNIKFDYGEGKYAELGAVLVDILLASMISDSRLISADPLTIRDMLKLQLEMYKSGACGTVSECFQQENNDITGAFGSDSNFVDAFSLILDDTKLPVNNKIVIEDGVEMLDTGLFYGARTDELVIPNSVIYIAEGAFAGIDISTVKFNGYKTNLDYDTGALFSESYIEKIVFAEGIERIGTGMFSNISTPVSVNFPSTLKTIGNNCFNDTKMKNNHLDLVNVEEIGDYAFYNSDIKTIDFGSRLKNIGNYAFYENDLSNLLSIPKTIVKIGDYAFSNNNISQLKFSLDSSTQLSNLESVGKYAFRYNIINEIIIPNNELNNILIDEYAFSDNNIVYVNLNKSVNEINEAAFSNNKIKRVELSESLKYLGKNIFLNNEITSIRFNEKLEEIGESAFENNNIVNLVLPESLKKIGYRAFLDNSIVNLKIPKNVEIISSYAFSDNKLKTLDFLVDEDTNECSLVDIYNYAFSGRDFGNNENTNSNSIESLVLPKSSNNGGYKLERGVFEYNKIKKLTLSESVILSNGVFTGNNIELIKVLGKNKDRYNSIWQSAGLPLELKIY